MGRNVPKNSVHLAPYIFFFCLFINFFFGNFKWKYEKNDREVDVDVDAS